MRKFPVLLLLLLAVLGFGLGGCSYYPIAGPRGPHFRVVVTNPSGELIADWVAHGRPIKTEHGYRFRAVERISGGAYPQHRVYPEGRIVEVGGPNIRVTRMDYWRTTTVTRTRTETRW